MLNYLLLPLVVTLSVGLACDGENGGPTGTEDAEAYRCPQDLADRDQFLDEPSGDDSSADPGADPGTEFPPADNPADDSPFIEDPGNIDIPSTGPSCLFPASAALAEGAVPEGFCAWTFAERLSTPRGIRHAPNGDVLVLERGSARVTVLWDADGNGVSGDGERAVLAQAPGLNHGLAVVPGSPGWLYASSASTVYRWPYTPGDRSDLGEPQVVVAGIPSGGHSTRTLVLDEQGRLYVSVGSASNVDEDSSRSRIRRFELCNIPSDGIPFAAGEIFADGLRNEVALAFDSMGVLWGVENGVDNLNRQDLGGDIHEDNPAEEVNRFDVAGRFYGYPYCFSEFLLPPGVGSGPGTQWAHPRFINDGTHDDEWCRDPGNVVPPVFSLPAHTAPLGMLFNDGRSLPPGYRGDAFVALHGSWNRDVPIGYKVVRLEFSDGIPVRFSLFLEAAAVGDRPGNWPHRPVDVAYGPRGEILVTSDATGVVLAVGWSPDPALRLEAK
jgi:glucose/arabinose dehydrogenase